MLVASSLAAAGGLLIPGLAVGLRLSPSGRFAQVAGGAAFGLLTLSAVAHVLPEIGHG